MKAGTAECHADMDKPTAKRLLEERLRLTLPNVQHHQSCCLKRCCRPPERAFLMT